MCKIVAFTNFGKIKNQTSATEKIGNILLELESDGFGYAIHGKNGVFGEKIAGPEKFRTRFDVSSFVRLPIIVERHRTFGTKGPAVGAALFHGRTSTNDAGLLNCHPMQREGWHLIHNGVVTDHGEKYEKKTTNDSEDVLHRLIQGIDAVERDLSGYYAFSAIDPTFKLHVARDSNATLFVAWSDDIDSFVFATTEDLLESVLKALKIKASPIEKVLDDCYMIFEGNTPVHQQKIKPRGYGRAEATWAHKSLGHSIDSGGYSDWRTQYEEKEDYFNRDSYIEGEELMRELDQMDGSYTIISRDEEYLTPAAYHKLDPIAQAECTIIRPDGSVVPSQEER